MNGITNNLDFEIIVDNASRQLLFIFYRFRVIQYLAENFQIKIVVICSF